MAKEYRQIVFQPREVVRAIVDYRRWRKDPLPEGKFTRFEMRADPLHADLGVTPEGAEAERTFTIQQDEIASALILFCINSKIPIPAKSKKDVKYVGDQLALTIAIDEQELH